LETYSILPVQYLDYKWSNLQVRKTFTTWWKHLPLHFWRKKSTHAHRLLNTGSKQI